MEIRKGTTQHWNKYMWSKVVRVIKLSTLLPVLMTLIALLGAAAGEAEAFSRAYVPRNVAIATAETIAVVRIVQAPEGAARLSAPTNVRVEIIRVLKGAWPAGKTFVRLSPFHRHAGKLNSLKTGETYIFFLDSLDKHRVATTAKTTAISTVPQIEVPSADVKVQPVLEVMIDGSQRYSELAETEITETLKLIPDWSKPQNGLSTVVVAEQFRVQASDNIDLWAGHKNVSTTDIILKYRDWPLETHTHWRLQVESPDKKLVAAVAHPHLTEKEIIDYFSRYPHSFDYKLKPGDTFFFPLARINSAKPGWGYKERLDFKYYPMTQQGSYRIMANGYNFYGKVVTQAKPLQVWVESPGK